MNDEHVWLSMFSVLQLSLLNSLLLKISIVSNVKYLIWLFTEAGFQYKILQDSPF